LLDGASDSHYRFRPRGANFSGDSGGRGGGKDSGIAGSAVGHAVSRTSPGATHAASIAVRVNYDRES
jgi:hypothetical protein